MGWRYAALRNGLRDSLQYRGEFLLEVLSSAFVPVIIQFILWSSIFSTRPNETIGGMSYTELMAYTWTSMLFSQIRGGNHDFALSEMIRTGTLSNYLLRPVGVLEFIYLRGLGEKLALTLIFFVVGLVACPFTPISLPGLIMAMTIALMGNLIHYLFGSFLAAAAFYWENAFALLMVKNMMVSLMCGELLPLSLIPEQYSFLWKSTPFYLYVYGPTQFALGKWGFADFTHHFGLALIWIFVFWILNRIAWKFSIHRYQGMGG
jgi:ABC-2 type transport system permease protein